MANRSKNRAMFLMPFFFISLIIGWSLYSIGFKQAEKRRRKNLESEETAKVHFDVPPLKTVR